MSEPSAGRLLLLDTLFAGPRGPLLIFCLRIIDVSMATLRMLLMLRNARLLVPLLGFVGVIVWIVAVGSAILNWLTDPLPPLRRGRRAAPSVASRGGVPRAPAALSGSSSRGLRTPGRAHQCVSERTRAALENPDCEVAQGFRTSTDGEKRPARSRPGGPRAQGGAGCHARGGQPLVPRRLSYICHTPGRTGTYSCCYGRSASRRANRGTPWNSPTRMMSGHSRRISPPDF